MGGYGPPPAAVFARAALDAGPMICIRHGYQGVGGRMFSNRTIKTLVKEGYAVYIGRGVASIRMLREASAAMQPPTSGEKQKGVT